MMRFRVDWAATACLAAVVAFLAACSSTPRVPPPSTDIDETAYRDHLRLLASDEFEGRRPGTPGEDKTVAYLVEQFRKLGLKPGNGESYVQQVPLVEIAQAGAPTLSIAGHGGSLALSAGKDMVLWSTQDAPRPELRQSGLVFAGYGIVAPEFGWNDYAGVEVRGKTVVVLLGDPGYALKDPKLFKGGAMTYYGRWAYKIEEAARQGAAGVLLVHQGEALGYPWNAVQSTWGGPQLSLASPTATARPAVEGWIQTARAQAIFRLAGLDFAASMAAAARPGFKATPLELYADATLQDVVRRFNSANVIALLPGTDRRRDCVVFTAHWDHLGRDPALPGHNIFNGAVDNASGVAGLLTLAQSFVRTKPAAERTLVFMALTAAEPGLSGSAFYVDNPVFPLRYTAAVLNLDGLRNRGPSRDLTIYGAGNTDLEDYGRAAALLQGRAVTPEPSPQWGIYYGSDAFSFANAGVPVLYATGGLDDSARGPAWGRAQLDDYMAHRYRQTADQYSENWDVRGALEDLALYYDVGNRVARTKRFPRWYPTSEFRVSHERNAAP